MGISVQLSPHHSAALLIPLCICLKTAALKLTFSLLLGCLMFQICALQGRTDNAELLKQPDGFSALGKYMPAFLVTWNAPNAFKIGKWVIHCTFHFYFFSVLPIDMYKNFFLNVSLLFNYCDALSFFAEKRWKQKQLSLSLW